MIASRASKSNAPRAIWLGSVATISGFAPSGGNARIALAQNDVAATIAGRYVAHITHHGDFSMTQPTRKLSRAAAADRADMIAQIRTATRFSAFMRYSPFDKTTLYFEVEDGDQRAAYAAARAALDELEAASRYPKRGLVYAINNLGSFSLDADLAQEAGLI